MKNMEELRGASLRQLELASKGFNDSVLNFMSRQGVLPGIASNSMSQHVIHILEDEDFGKLQDYLIDIPFSNYVVLHAGIELCNDNGVVKVVCVILLLLEEIKLK